MDSNAVVNTQLDGGAEFLKTLRAEGVEVTVAFWAKLFEGYSYSLYIASPAFGDDDEKLFAYGVLQKIFAYGPAFGIELFDVRAVGADYSMALAAAEIVRPKSARAKVYDGVTAFRGEKLGGVEIDGAYIYPPPRAAVNA